MTIGKDLVDANAGISYFDSCTVQLSTIFVDSIVTSGKKSFLVGNYRDTLTGLTKASCFLTFASPAASTSDNTNTTSSFVLNKNAVFDSITLQVRANTDFYGDTLRSQNIKVHRLLQPIKYRINGSSYYPFYNTSVTAYDSINTIGSKTFVRKPVSHKKHEIRLDDSIGLKLFNVLQSKIITATDAERFKKFFPGIVLTSGSSNSSLTGFYTDSTKLRLYCHVTTSGKDTIVNLSIGNNSSSSSLELQFNRIQFDRTGKDLENLNHNNKEISSSNTGNKAYLQNLSGIYAKVKFPYLPLLLNQWTYGEVTKAELWVYPPVGTYKDGVMPLADTISMYYSDVYDNLTQAVNSSKVVLTGNVNIDKSSNLDTRYTYDITSFIQDQLPKTGVAQEFLLLKIPASGAPRRVVFGDQNYPNYNYRVKLKIYYTHYDSN
jgi:hypothetical protein